MAPPRQGSVAVRRWVPYGFLAAGLVLTLAGTLFVHQITQSRAQLAFERAAADTVRLIEMRLVTYVELLRAGAALFASSSDVTLDEFKAFTGRLRIGERYPGIQGIGYTAVLRDAEPLRIDPRQYGIQPWPTDGGEPATAIVFLEPPDARNRRALGYDMFSEPVRRAAMVLARDTGEPAASGVVRLVQEIDGREQPGFLIYTPVYRNDRSTETVETRRAALDGYVYAPFRGEDLLAGIFGDEPPIPFSVYDGDAVRQRALLYRSPGAATPAAAPHVQRLMVSGRRWTLEFDRGVVAMSRLVPFTALAGLTLTFGLFAVMRAQQQAWEATLRMTDEVRSSEDALRETSDRLRRLVVLEREARAEAQQADRAKDEFLATLSHELRTPLNAMLGWLSMLRTGKVREERRADALDVVERNARVQAKLIEDLLDVSRIIAGKIHLDVHPLDLGAIVAAVAEAQRPAADQKGVRLSTAIVPGLPTVDGDASRLQQVTSNLLANAIKFTPAGGEVSVGLDRVGTALLLQVRDTGIGIPPEFLPHVFERFRQADSSTTRTHSGVGLGLAIVRHLVALHGGTIDAFSDGAGKGALFVARLPISGQGSIDVA